MPPCKPRGAGIGRIEKGGASSRFYKPQTTIEEESSDKVSETESGENE